MSRLIRSLWVTTLMGGLATLSTISTATAQTTPWVALPDGTLDPRFDDGDGIAITPGDVDGTFDGPVAALQPDGKIIYASGWWPFAPNLGVLARYTVDGHLDPTFGVDGLVYNMSGGASRLIVQPDGKLLTRSYPNFNLIVRYNPDGSPDLGFGVNGRISWPGEIHAFALQADGRILTTTVRRVGQVDRPLVSRYDANGSLDLTFGAQGSATTDVASPAANVVLSQPDGKIIVSGFGYAGQDGFTLVRLNADGTFDSGFGSNGIVNTVIDGSRSAAATSALLLPDGRILVAGSNGGRGRSDFALVRYLANGELDGTFGIGGKVLTRLTVPPAPDASAVIERIALQADGRIVAVGIAVPVVSRGQGTWDRPEAHRGGIAVVRYHSNGAVDTTFGDNGTVLTDIDQRYEQDPDLVIQPDGQIIVPALTRAPTPGCDCNGFPILARYRNDSARGVFGAATRPVPAHVEAEDYDLGGQGTGYSDTTPGNEGGRFVYRTDDVDIKLSNEGGHAVGWLAAGEWLAYTVDVEQEGRFTVDARIGSALPGRTFHIEVDGTDVSGPIAVPEVGNWDTYGQAISPSFSLTAGRHVLRLVIGPEDYIDFQSFDIAAAAASGPFGGTPRAVPGLIEAEDYDLGGQGRGYLDSTAGNEGGVYRADDVDIKPSRDGGYAVGWLAAGEWVAYSIEVQTDGVYTIAARAGSMLPNRTFHIEVDGTDVTGAMAVPQTGDWDTYDTVSAPGIPLSAGSHVLKVVIGAEDWIDFDRLEIVR